MRELIWKKRIPTGWASASAPASAASRPLNGSIRSFWKKGRDRVNPLLVPLMISNMAAGNVSIQFGLKGKSLNVVTACATGTHSIGEAMRAIQHGEAEVMVAGGTESSHYSHWCGWLHEPDGSFHSGGSSAGLHSL